MMRKDREGEREKGKERKRRGIGGDSEVKRTGAEKLQKEKWRRGN